MFKKAWEYKKVRFVCIGIFNTAVDFTILNTLVVYAKFPVWLGNTISVSVAASISYFLNHHIVFRHKQPPTIKGYLKFFIVTVIGVIIIQTIIIYITKPLYESLVKNINLLNNLNHKEGIALNLAKATAVLVGMVWNYSMYSLYIFKKHNQDIPKDPVI